MIRPEFEEIEYKDPILYFNCIYNRNWSMFLDSSDVTKAPSDRNRYSYIVLDPFEHFICKDGGEPFEYLQKITSQYAEFEAHSDLPPFQGGLCGLFSYDLLHYFESVPRPKSDDMAFYDLAIGCYDLVLSFDHQEQKAFVVSSGLPKIDRDERKKQALDRIGWLKSLISNGEEYDISNKPIVSSNTIQSNFTRSEYHSAVTKTIDYIKAGDIFEANISQRFKTSLPDGTSPFDVYQRLRKLNPAPFAAFLNINDVAIASASPERFLECHNGFVEARPIKGTCPRGENEEEDRKLGEQLTKSEKDRAENIMIVDLMRNDLSRVCADDSVKVEQLCKLESFPTVHHLVSVVKGKLAAKKTAIDLLKACFPGGSITGAPKIRSMEIIYEIEPNRRGPYCGSVGYIGFDGAMDLSIVIRTFCIHKQELTFQAGGAIVMDSDPEAEYQETLQKVSALSQSLTMGESL